MTHLIKILLDIPAGTCSHVNRRTTAVQKTEDEIHTSGYFLPPYFSIPELNKVNVTAGTGSCAIEARTKEM
jgi:hypothetical protein